MVLTTLIRRTARRIPMIKFRSGGNGHSKSGHPLEANLEPEFTRVAATAAAPTATQTRAVSSGPAIEDWQLPAKYRRRPIDDNEINAINSGGAYV